jgi:pre-mRNA-splicing factor ATP-dependent RNA helicase DHX16
MEINSVPEIQRTSLTNLVLITKSLGIKDVLCFDFMDSPPAETLVRSLEKLYALGALNECGDLTKLGRRMAEFPIDPQLSKMVLVSEKYKVSYEAATIAAMVSCSGTAFYRPKDRQIQADSAHRSFYRSSFGDHIALMMVFNEWKVNNFSIQFCIQNFVQFRTMKRARDVRDQLISLMERVELNLDSNASDHQAIRKSITAGYFFNVARLRKDGSYQTIKSPASIYIHPSSGLYEDNPKFVVYHEIILTSKEYMRTISEIKPGWLIEVAPHIYNQKDLEKDFCI